MGMHPVELPLFPLPVVLFPGAMTPLHIFETRYRELLAEILPGDRRFGLVYHDPDESGPFLNEPGRVGTVAEVKTHEPLPDGRSLVLVVGLHRFEILEEVMKGTRYFMARVGPYEDAPIRSPGALVARRRASHALFQQLLRGLDHGPEPPPSLDPEGELSFKLAATVRVDPKWKQELLEITDEAARLDRLDPIFRLGIDRWGEGGPGRD